MWPAGAGSAATYAALRSQEHRGHSDTHKHRLLRQHHCSRKVGQPMGKAGLVQSIRRSRRCVPFVDPSRPSLSPRVAVSPNSFRGRAWLRLPDRRANSEGLFFRGYELGVAAMHGSSVCDRLIAERNRSVDPTGVSFRGQESITPCGGINSPRC